MKKLIIVTVFFICGLSTIQAQYVLKNQDDVKWYVNLPQEEVYIHTNTSLLFAGESLFYKVYCKNSKTILLSKNSKIAYIELVGKEGLVSRHKICLDGGVSQGDFFIPTSIKTGNYKLIGYTRWMLNREDESFFETDITIINPYANIDFEEKGEIANAKISSNSKRNNLLELVTNSDSYGKREQVNLVVESLDIKALGNYSISVRKTENMEIDNVGVTKDLNNQDKPANIVGNKLRTVGETIFLPEFKGEMLTGTVKDKSTGNPINNVKVALSVLSNEAIQDIAKTNDKGIFYFQISNTYKTPKALIQVLGDNKNNYVLEVDEHQPVDYSDLKFTELKLNASLKKSIIQHSVNNQIENAYLSVKRDELIAPNYPKPFFGNPMTTYKLDDYKRFSNVAETLDEVVDHAYHERRNGKTRYINVRERETDPYYDVDILPMVLVDGASIQDHQNLLAFEAKNVESMSVLRQEYYYGDKVYQGVLMINTFSNDYYKNLNGDYLKVIDLESPQLKTKYFQQDYSNKVDHNRVPDQRTQLLWVPDLKLKEKRNQITFYTSDVKGTYRISLKGFTDDGKPTSISKTFTVN